MKEIGGYIELEKLSSHEYYPDLIALNSACNALIYIIRARKIKKLYLPYFLCDSVSETCVKEGCKIEYYHVSQSFFPLFKNRLHDDEYLYIVNYYGQISNDLITQYKTKFQHIIIDNVQAFFQEPVKNVDTIYSCRKFFGVPDGSYLSTNTLIDMDLPIDVSMHRLKHLLGRFEIGNASLFYSDYKNNEALFRNIPLAYMSKLTHQLLGAIDYNSVIEARSENFKFLHSILGQRNCLQILPTYGAFAYPFFCSNGIHVRHELAKKKIYIPTLWPNVIDYSECVEAKLAENILPLPVDQRYTIEDMKYLVKELEQCMIH